MAALRDRHNEALDACLTLTGKLKGSLIFMRDWREADETSKKLSQLFSTLCDLRGPAYFLDTFYPWDS